MNIGEVELARNLRVMTKLISINQLILLIINLIKNDKEVLYKYHMQTLTLNLNI